MKLKIVVLLVALVVFVGVSYSQNCPATWGSSSFKMVKLNTTDLDKLCNENPAEGPVIKEAATSSAASGSGNGYQWEKKNGKITIMWDKVKFNSSKIANAIRKFFRK